MASYLLPVWNIRLNPHETFSTLEEESLTLFRGDGPRDVAAKPLGHLLSLRREMQHTWSTRGMLRATICYLFFWSNNRKAWVQVPYAREEGWKCGSEELIIFVNRSDMNNAKSWESWDAKFAVLYYFYNKKKPHQTYNPLHILSSSSQNDKNSYFIASCTGGDVLQQPKCNKLWTVNSCEVK